MTIVASLALLLATSVAPVAGEAADQDTIAIHVYPTEAKRPEGEEKKALQKELRVQADAARDELKALEKDVKQQFGKKRESSGFQAIASSRRADP